MEQLKKVLNWMESEFPNLEKSYHDGKNEQGKQITNPTYGFGTFQQTYTNGEKKTHFQIGIAETRSGISIYLLGIRGKMNLANACNGLGNAKVSSYCISFKRFDMIDPSILKEILKKSFIITSNH